ncbi:UDP-glucose/GDP-mannose dehydrogenase family protein [Mitsuaria sp. WAJ17]|nr:UDP-glucose/GDP-mannose dehydrogenase family protein [Mitsuaria sp. WAJ17]
MNGSSSAPRHLAVFGAGYVGLVSAACLAWLGHEVVCVDSQPRRLRQLRRGRLPFHEPLLGELLQEQLRTGRLRFSSSARAAVNHGDVLFIAVGTPTAADGAAELGQVMQVADDIGRHMPGPRQVVMKSTVPVGTGERVRQRIRERLAQRGACWALAVASNPEFLREGLAVQDFLRPERVVAGSDDARLLELLRELHAPLLSAQRPFLAMDLRSAELCKYAANVMLAARLSLMNELALLAEGLGADIEQVREGLGRDPRIGPLFLRAGCGFGGSCLPKDLRALRHSAAILGHATPMLDAIAASNERMVGLLEARVCEALGEDLRGRCIAVWGLAFKPQTDDVRESPALALVRALSLRGAQVQAYDPMAGAAALEALGELPGFQLAGSALEALQQADALLLVTDWPQFAALPGEALRARLRGALVLDGRNALDGPQLAAAGLQYRGIGRAVAKAVVPPVEAWPQAPAGRPTQEAPACAWPRRSDHAVSARLAG